MQQMFTCPNCGAIVTYGQPQCPNCKMAFTWQPLPVQEQNQQLYTQYGNQQAQWGQQQDSGQQQQVAGKDQKKIQIGSSVKSAVNSVSKFIKSNPRLVRIILASVIAVISLVCLGLAFQEEIARLTSKPVINSFDASSSSIIIGHSATLQWDVSGPGSVTIEPGIGKVPSNGMTFISPEIETTYVLTASNMFGSTKKSVKIDVTGVPPSIVSFALDKDTIYAGQSATLTWNVKNATSVDIEPEIGNVESSGSIEISPRMKTRYVLTATNSASNVSASQTINVNSTNKPIINSFKVGSQVINSGEITTLSWDVIGAASVNITEGVGRVPAKGSMEIHPAATTTYTLMAGSDYGTETSSVTVTVYETVTATTPITTDPPVISSFKVSKNSIMLTDQVTLTWTVKGARSVSISPSVGAVPTSGWTQVYPVANTTYTLYASNTFGTTHAEVMVDVSRDGMGESPVIKVFQAIPSTISAGQTTTLSWAVENATMLLLDQGIGIPVSKFSQIVSPTENTTYTLTAFNKSDTDIATVTVTVKP